MLLRLRIFRDAGFFRFCAAIPYLMQVCFW